MKIVLILLLVSVCLMMLSNIFYSFGIKGMSFVMSLLAFMSPVVTIVFSLQGTGIGIAPTVGLAIVGFLNLDTFLASKSILIRDDQAALNELRLSYALFSKLFYGVAVVTILITL